MMEYYQTTEHVKEEVVDCGIAEVSQDEHQLCTACLCATRTTHTLGDDDALKQYYMHILTEMQPEGGVVVLQSPRVCWECVSHLKRSVRFREQVQDSYRLLQPMLAMCDQEDLDEFLQTSVCRPGRLQTCFALSIDIPPQHDDMLVMTAVKHDDNDDDEAALESLEYDVERRSSTFRENDAAIDDDPLEPYCADGNSVTEELVQLSLMGNYNHEKNVKQEETEALRIETINTPNCTHESTGDGNTTFVCDYCHKSFSSKAAIERHIATYNIYPHNNKAVPSPCKDCAVALCSDDQCSECPNKHNLLQHSNMKINMSKVLYQCMVCHKSISDKRNARRHERTHTGEKLYQCEVCHKSFSQKQVLLNHVRTHTGEKPYLCKVCHKSFSRKDIFSFHIRIHTGNKLYQCEVCHKSFPLKSNLEVHLRTHSGEKPYQCEVCHKSFSQKHHLMSHVRTHTGEKPYQCKVCHKSFSVRCTLVRHIRTHRTLRTKET